MRPGSVHRPGAQRQSCSLWNLSSGPKQASLRVHQPLGCVCVSLAPLAQVPLVSCRIREAPDPSQPERATSLSAPPPDPRGVGRSQCRHTSPQHPPPVAHSLCVEILKHSQISPRRSTPSPRSAFSEASPLPTPLKQWVRIATCTQISEGAHPCPGELSANPVLPRLRVPAYKDPTPHRSPPRSLSASHPCLQSPQPGCPG